MAKYRFLAVAYQEDRLWQAGEFIDKPDDFEPYWYMKPMDAAAKKMAKKVGLVNVEPPDPIDELTSIGASPAGSKTGILAGEDVPL